MEPPSSANIYIYSKLPLNTARIDLEDELEAILGEEGECTGGGSGAPGWNIDLEIHDSRHLAKWMKQLATYLRVWGVPPDTYLVGWLEGSSEKLPVFSKQESGELTPPGLPPNARLKTSSSGTQVLVDAPFLPDQVASMNAYQMSGQGHPFTCGNDRKDEAHRAYQGLHGGDFGQLLATETGWICPVCGYQQSWGWLWMSDWSWARTED